MQSNIEKLLDYNSKDDTIAEEMIEETLEQSPQVDIGAIIQRINDLEEKVNVLMKNEKEDSETPPEEAVENSEEDAAAETTETETETITEEKENDNDS